MAALNASAGEADAVSPLHVGISLSAEDAVGISPAAGDVSTGLDIQAVDSAAAAGSGSGVPASVLRLRSLYSSPASRPRSAGGASANEVTTAVSFEDELARADSARGGSRVPALPRVANLAAKGRSPRAIPHALSRRAFAQSAESFEQRTVEELTTKASGFGATLLLAYYTIGTIYGDIGTSPLYTISSILGVLPNAPTENDLLGAASLCFWFLTLLPLLKYVFIVLYADDMGEGGTFAVYSNLCRHARISLLGSRKNSPEEDALVNHYTNAGGSPARVHGAQPGDEELTEQQKVRIRTQQARVKWLPRGSAKAARALLERYWWVRQALLVLALLGTCGVLADGVLTPAISVLSAVQGLQRSATGLSQGGIIGITCAILIVLFTVQQLGTARLAFTFSPILSVWFLLLAGTGIFNIASYMPGVFKAVSPWYAFNFLTANGFYSWVALGQVLLAVTGSEALFADMGHFSRPAIQLAFTFVLYPSVILAYFGQTAYLSQHPDDVSTAFYASIPNGLYWPALIIATLAAIVASQALITGAFSVIKQSLILSCFPRVRIVHTSGSKEGQIYIPVVNWTLMVLTVAVVAGFQDGTAIGNAYGVTVAMVMLVTTTLVSITMLVSWDLSLLVVLPFWLFYTGLEGVVFSSTLFKVPYGGWFPLVVTAVLLVLMYTWHFGTYKKKHYTQEHNLGEEHLYTLLANASDVDGVAVVYSEIDEGVPPVLLHYLANVPALQKVVVCLTVKPLPLPRLEYRHRMLIAPMAYQGKAFPGFYRVIVYYGYTEKWDHSHEFLGILHARLVTNILERRSAVAATVGEGAAPGTSITSGEAEPTRGASSPAHPHLLESTLTQWKESEKGVVVAAGSTSKGGDALAVEGEGHVVPSLSWRLPERGVRGEGASQGAMSIEAELELLNTAWNFNQVFFMGRTSIHASDGANLATKALIPAYSLLKSLASNNVAAFHVPTDRLLEVGMVYQVK